MCSRHFSTTTVYFRLVVHESINENITWLNVSQCRNGLPGLKMLTNHFLWLIFSHVIFLFYTALVDSQPENKSILVMSDGMVHFTLCRKCEIGYNVTVMASYLLAWLWSNKKSRHLHVCCVVCLPTPVSFTASCVGDDVIAILCHFLQMWWRPAKQNLVAWMKTSQLQKKLHPVQKEPHPLPAVQGVVRVRSNKQLSIRRSHNNATKNRQLA